MKIKDLVSQLDLNVLAGHSGLENEVTGAYVSDLLSDVMGNILEGQVWITLQTHLNVIAIASLRDVAGLILIQRFEPEPDMLKKADEEGIPVLTTGLTTFEISGKLYRILYP